VEDKLELMEQNPNHKTNGPSVGTPSCITDTSGNGIPNAIGDSGETPRPRGSNLLQEPDDFGICSSFNQHVCGVDSSENGEIDVQQCKGCSNKDHQCSLENRCITNAAGKLFSDLPELQGQFDSRISIISNQEPCVDCSENGEINVQQCKGCSNKDHQCSLENRHINNAAGKSFSDLPELQGQCDSRIGLISNQESCVGGQGDKHTSVGDGRENGDMAAGKTLLSLIPQRILLRGVDPRYPRLLLPNLSKVEKVVFTLDMVRRRELFEYNTRIHCTLPTRFCEYNIAFFDLDKESDYKREPQFSKIPDSYWRLDTSINIISIKVSESDVPYPINIYGTVVARDQVDYRCVYLFKRDRDNPQCITSVDDALTLTGPYRALAGDVMFFEFNLKIIMGDEEAVDQEFSKGLLDRRMITHESLLLTKSLDSCLSKVEMEFNNIQMALEAYIEVNILNEESYFHGKITAGYKKTGMVLYDSKVAGTEIKLGCGGSVSLTRRVVAVSWGNDLVLRFSVPRAKPKSKCIRLEHYEEKCKFELGTYELQVKIVWTGVLTKHRKKVLKHVGRALLVL